MIRTIAAVALCSIGLSTVIGDGQIVPGGGAAGGNAFYLNNGDIIGVRNIQGGSAVNPPWSLNLDVGAGSKAQRGNVNINYDIGRCLVIFDGHRHKLASFCHSGINFYSKPHIHRGTQ